MAEADTVLDTAADEADDAKRGLIEQALAGEAITAPTTIAAEVQQDDLEAVLAASLEAVGA
jgi:hypothetical protein